MHTRTRRHLLALYVSVLAMGALACDDDPAAPPEEAGSYEATTLVETAPGGDVDHLALGSTISLRLHDNHTTTGTMFIVGGDEDGSDYTADLTGTWSVDGDQVDFQHNADTFIRDIAWTYEDGRLSAENSDVLVVLTRQ